MPTGLAFHQMVLWNKELVVLGGDVGSSFSSACFMLKCHNGIFSWDKMKPKMMKARYRFTAIKITPEMAKKWTS